jgi:hypothetical protein
MCYWRGFGNEARASITKSCKWRIEENASHLRTQSLESIIGCRREDFERFYTCGLLGFTPAGEPVAARTFGDLEMQGLRKTLGKFEGDDREELSPSQ